MLVLSRCPDETIHVSGPCVITIIRVGPNTARLGIEADKSTSILRGELVKREEANGLEPMADGQKGGL